MNQLDKLKKRFEKNKFVSAVLTLVTGQALGQAIGLITTPIVSRLYDTVAYGEYAIVVSTATIICTVSQAGLSSAIMMPVDEEEAKKVFNAASIFQVAVSTLVILVMLVIASWIQAFELRIPYILGLIFMWVYIVLTNCNNMLRIYMNRLKMYKALFWNSILSACTTLFVTIPLGFVHTDFNGLLIAACVAAAGCVVQMLVKANPFQRISLHDIKRVIIDYKRFVFLQLPANMIGTLSQQLPNQVLGASMGTAALGSYSMSNKILGIPSRMIASPINTVYFRTAVDYVRDGRDLAGFTFSLVKRIMYAWVPIILILIVCGDRLFGFVLGERWEEAGIISAILAFQYMFTFCMTSTGYCRVALDRQGINLTMSLVNLALIAISLFVGVMLFSDVIGILACFAVGGSLARIIDVVANFICLKKYPVQFLLFAIGYVLVVGGLGIAIRTLI